MRETYRTTGLLFLLLSIYLLEMSADMLFSVKEGVKHRLYIWDIVGTRGMKHYITTAMQSYISVLIRSSHNDSWSEIEIGCIYCLFYFGQIRVITFYSCPHRIPNAGISATELQMEVLSLIANTNRPVFVYLWLATEFSKTS